MTADPTPDLAALRALAEAATPGPWHWSDPWADGCVRFNQPVPPGSASDITPTDFFAADDPQSDPEMFHSPSRRLMDAFWHNDGTAGLYVRPADAAYIVALVNAAPRLIELARSSALDVERLREAIYTVSVRHNWAETMDTEDRTKEIAAEYAALADRG